jgi:lysophospholipase L1-like esterase
MPKRLRTLSRSRKLLFAAIVLGVSAFAAEGYARWQAAQERGGEPGSLLVSDPVTGMALNREFKGTSHSGFGVNVDVSINSLGHRDDEGFRPLKAAGAFRIACLGGSTTFGFGASNNAAAYPNVLEAELGVGVLNAGVHGWNVRSSLLNLRRLPDLGLDGVVVLHGHNDLYENWSPTYVAAAEGRSAPLPSALVRALETSAALRRLRRRILRSRRKTNKHTALNAAGAEAFETNLRELVGELRGRRVRVLLCTFPSLYAPTFEEIRAIYPDAKGKHSAQIRDHLRNSIHTYPVFARGLARYNQIIRQVAKSEGVGLADLERTLEDDPAYYVDFVHHTDAGHVAKAKLIAESIRRERWLPVTPR